MRRIFSGVSLLLVMGILTVLTSVTAWSMDEAVLTPTTDTTSAQQDKAFDDAMDVWFKHRYADGEKLLRQFSEKHPNSRWTAEADLHIGCYLTYLDRLGEARSVFTKVIEAHPDHIVATKAKVRLGNVAERAGRFDEAISHYCDALQENPSWDQFRYANYRARKLIMTRGQFEARINCGPVALAACLDALDKPTEAASARAIQAGSDGMSMVQLKTAAEEFGVQAHPVKMSAEDLRTADLPVVAHVRPNHYVAVIGIEEDKAQVHDSILGKYEMSVDALGRIWTGIVLSFSPKIEDEPLAMTLASTTMGGCCGQADDDECLGCCPSDCNQLFSGGTSGGSGCSGGSCPVGVISGGAPSWEVNVINLNLIVRDTPIWYNPGKGPGIAFTLTYSNENSNTGIFGRGWRSPYDMKVFFLPSGDTQHPTLQVHRDGGRIETYVWNSTANKYLGRSTMINYGYRDDITLDANGVVTMALKGGGKYVFMPEGDAAEGRIHYITDQAGYSVTCDYDQWTGALLAIRDACNNAAVVWTESTGFDERVTRITIPDGRFAVFGYTDGYLTSITDMAGYESTLSYDALAWQQPSFTTLVEAITTSDPAHGGIIKIAPIEEFPPSGTVLITNTSEPAETELVEYARKTDDHLEGITRGSMPIDALAGSQITLVGTSNVPYLSTIETPSRKTMFTYEWWTFTSVQRPVVALHEVYECAAGEQYPSVPTIHYAWCSTAAPVYTAETRYPASVTPGGLGCNDHWTGGATRKYKLGPAKDEIGEIADVVGNEEHVLVTYEYEPALRNRTAQIDGNGNRTEFEYDTGNTDDYLKHNMLLRRDPLKREWRSFYYTDPLSYTYGLLEREQDPKGNNVRVYFYDSSRRVTKVETELTPGIRSVLMQNVYHPTGTTFAGLLDYTLDGRGKSTTYHYNEDGETRGFLTSIEDPENHGVSYRYDTAGRRDQVTDANGRPTTYEFDDLDRIVKVTNPDNTFVETQYSCCHKDWVKDENGKVTKYEYDKRNRLWATIDAAIDTPIAQGIAATDTQIVLANTAGFPGNGSALLKSPDGNVEMILYSGISGSTLTGVTRGQFGTVARDFTAATVTEGNMIAYVYDEDIIDANGNYTHRGILDRKVGLYDPNGHLTQYEYYPDGKLKKTAYPDGTWEQYTYDPAGNMTKKEYGHNPATGDPVVTKWIGYVYDALNRLVSTHGQ